jgi:ABC-type phosphate/phosphonate transport system substrate-binding protein
MSILRRAAFVLLVVGLASTRASADDKSMIFGVLNQQSPPLTAERWNPILAHVTAVTGIPFKLRMGPTVVETNGMMGRGEFDFAFTNHNFQAEFDSIGYKVIARWAGDPIRCVIAVPEDSHVQNLKQLDTKRVAFPSRDAFVGYAVPLVALKKAGVKVEEVLAGNQEGVLAQLKARRVEAGAVNSRFLTQYAERENVRFREIFVSDAYPELAVIVHPRVPASTVEKVRQAFVGMRTDPGAAPVLIRVKFKGFEPATDRDYDEVRRVYRQIGQ